MSRPVKKIRIVNIVAVVVILLLAVTSSLTGIDLVALAYVELVGAGVLTVAFTVLYVGRSQWRQFAAGRSLLYVSVMLAVTFLIISASRFLGPNYPGRAVIIFVGFGGMAVVLLNLLLTLLRIQRAKATGELPPGDVRKIPR